MNGNKSMRQLTAEIETIQIEIKAISQSDLAPQVKVEKLNALIEKLGGITTELRGFKEFRAIETPNKQVSETTGDRKDTRSYWDMFVHADSSREPNPCTRCGSPDDRMCFCC